MTRTGPTLVGIARGAWPWVGLLALASCGIARTPEPDPAAVFPHPAHYAQAALHGRDATDNPLVLCMTCHTPDSQVAPTCQTCHASYPHPMGWRAGDRHGRGVAQDQTDCVGCHTEGRTAGACTQCHASFPHPDHWADGGQHGVYALARGDLAAACGTCHGAALDGGDSGVACTRCHADYPHTTDWALPSQHAAKIDGCTGCHGAALDGGTSGVSCTTCHSVYPHPADWKTGHLAVVGKVGEGACLTCHDPGDGGAERIATCSGQCHGG